MYVLSSGFRSERSHCRRSEYGNALLLTGSHPVGNDALHRMRRDSPASNPLHGSCRTNSEMRNDFSSDLIENIGDRSPTELEVQCDVIDPV